MASLHIPTEPVEIPAGPIQLRPFEAAFDAQALHQAAHDPDIGRWNPSVRALRDPAVAQAKAAEWGDWSPGTDLIWAIKESTTGRLAGAVVVVGIDAFHSTGEVGYWLVPEFRGRGFATRAVGAASRYAFGAVGLARLAIIHAVDNSASCAVAERCGFPHEATLRSSGAVGDGTERVDEHIHGRLATD